jgi:hypothetical protein
MPYCKAINLGSIRAPLSRMDDQTGGEVSIESEVEHNKRLVHFRLSPGDPHVNCLSVRLTLPVSGGERADASRRPLQWLVRRPFDLGAHSMT